MTLIDRSTSPYFSERPESGLGRQVAEIVSCLIKETRQFLDARLLYQRLTSSTERRITSFVAMLV